ncbi:MAG: DUF2834 domain-containing protein [Thermomicrobiales bacterium]
MAIASGTRITPAVRIHSRAPTLLLVRPNANTNLRKGYPAHERLVSGKVFHVEQQARRHHLVPIFAVLTVLGTVVPLATVAPWLAANGLNLQLFVQELFANRVSAFFAWDVVISAISVIVAALAWPGLTGRKRLAVIAGTLMIGVSCGLPLLLTFWARGNEDQVR